MRRLPADMCLVNILRRGGATEEYSNGLLKKIGHFYRSLPAEQVDPVEYRKRLHGLVTQNRDDLLECDHDFAPATIKRLHSSQLQMLEFEVDAFDDRVREGRIVEGHGDLRPEHVYFDPMPLIIDCIEFNRQIRQLDVLDELCFFEMECDRLGVSSVGRGLTDGIGFVLRDSQPTRLCNFYKCYRACVRAKVAVIRAAQVESNGHDDIAVPDARDDARQYLELAQEYEKEFASKQIIVVRGLMGTGKTTVAAAIAGRLGAEHLMTDRIRRDLFNGADDRPHYGDGRYSDDYRLRVYTEMFRRAEALLQSGSTVVLDGTFLSSRLRMFAHSLARRHGANCAILRCNCPRDVAMERIAHRKDNDVLSEARPELFDQQCRDEDTTLGAGHETDLQTVGSVDECVAAALGHLKSGCSR
jgi:predicted kinase